MTQNWWLRLGDEFIGYFPMKLFSNMTSADEVGWGGRTGTHVNTRSPQMGSGNYPNDDNVTHACFFKHVFIEDSSRKSHEVIHPSDTRIFIDSPKCYNVRYPDYYYGTFLFFGGPGGYCDN